jgi:uncharacterized protein YukJ
VGAVALQGYGVLVGRVVQTRAEGGGDSPHFQVLVQAGDTAFRVAVNVLSQESPSELLFLADEQFAHPVLTALADVPDGFRALASEPGGAALDFIRGNLFDPSRMQPSPATAPGPDNDLADRLDHYTSRAVADQGARLYAFGQRWGPEDDKPDKVFGFHPGNGVHDIHMNQGNDVAFAGDDGVWQDGGLLFHFAQPDQWVAFFLTFQSQSWHTDDATGHRLDSGPGVGGGGANDGRLRIVGALVNPVGPAPEQESVTLLNPRAEALDLAGWSLVDRAGQTMTLDSGQVGPGDTVRIDLHPPVQLGNHGGTLTVTDPAGVKVDGIAYTGEQAAHPGTTLVF